MNDKEKWKERQRVKKKPVQVEGQIRLKIVHARSRLFILS